MKLLSTQSNWHSKKACWWAYLLEQQPQLQLRLERDPRMQGNLLRLCFPALVRDIYPLFFSSPSVKTASQCKLRPELLVSHHHEFTVMFLVIGCWIFNNKRLGCIK